MNHVVGEENMTLAELALFHAMHEFDTIHGLLAVSGKYAKAPFSIDTTDARKVINELCMSDTLNDNQKVSNALFNAKHHLEELNGLVVADGAVPEETFSLDETERLALIDKALHSLNGK